ncbi:MAG: hypothetical protein ACXAC7_18800 [Candidatus Hodarchaeales archaeon]|jgi:hypothetical protein
MISKKNIWSKILFEMSIILTVSGFLLAIVFPLFLQEVIEILYNIFTNKEFSNLEEIDKKFILWTLGVCGAIMTGYGMIAVLLSYQLMKDDQKWLWNAISISIITWYLVDSTISIIFGAMFNVLLNTFILVMFIIPIIGKQITSNN